MSDERPKKTCAVPRPNRRPASKRNPPCKLNAEGVPNSTIFNGIDALSLFPDQALAGDPFSIAIVSSNLPDMNGLTLAKIAKADALLNGTHFIIAASFPTKHKSQQRELLPASSGRSQSQLFAALEAIGKTADRISGKKRASIDSCDSRHAAKDGVSQDLQIVRVGPLGETLQRTILLFEASRREEVLTVLGGVLRTHYPCCWADDPVPQRFCLFRGEERVSCELSGKQSRASLAFM